ncbi:MAG: MAC/perforin domain-containing protein [Gammaproteobacteria bacterium]
MNLKLFRMFSKLILSLFIFSIACTANATAPNPKCPTDYFYRGYDLFKGNPAAETWDPGWREPIMEKTLRDPCVYCSSATSCAAKYQVFDMQTDLDYLASLSQSAFVSGDSEDFFKETSFTGSAEYYYHQEDVFGAGLVSVKAEGACQLYEGGRSFGCTDVTFSSAFLNAVADLPISTQDPKWLEKTQAFFNSFGTHMAGNLSLGARWGYESLFTRASYEGLRAGNVDINVAAEASAELFRTKGASAAFESQQTKSMRVAFDAAREQGGAYFLGAPPPESLTFSDWANNIENPVPQKYTLKPIAELLNSKFFPEDVDIDGKRAVIEAAYATLQPEPPILVNVMKSEKGKYQTKNRLSVACPDNYQLISSGCKTEPRNVDGAYWIIASLKPVNNEAQCIVNMDYYPYYDASSDVNYKGLDVSATCLRNDYIEEKQVVTCDGPVGMYASECVAKCPVGFDVTGGGCESNSPDEQWPWKTSRSTPLRNTSEHWSGWSCKMGEDGYTGTYNRMAKGYAVCVRYTDGVVADQKILSEQSGTVMQYTNGSEVSCGMGYDALSGGCSVPVFEQAYLEWKIVETLPMSNGKSWGCFAQEDGGTLRYNQDVRSDALCVKFNK